MCPAASTANSPHFVLLDLMGSIFRAQFQWRDYLKFKFCASMVCTWMIWVPAVSAVYCFPGELQVILFNIVRNNTTSLCSAQQLTSVVPQVLCFWTLVFSYVSKTTS
jgi:hypothetical protein